MPYNNSNNKSKSNSRFQKPSGKYVSKKKTYEKPPESAFLSLGKHVPDEETYDASKKYPTMSGFLNVTPAALQLWMENDVIYNAEYNTFGLSVACWEKDGRLNCSVQFPYIPEEEEEVEEVVKKKSTLTKTTTPITPAKKATAKKKLVVLSDGDDTEEDEGFEGEEDIPF